MIYVVYKKNEMPTKIAKVCLELIHDRFEERWGVIRNDITINAINNRLNAVAFENEKVVGILGLEDTGEFTTGCSIKTVNGIFLLSNLAKQIIKKKKVMSYLYFAFYPRTDLAIPAACYYATDGFLEISPERQKKKYSSVELTLIKINLFTNRFISKNDFFKLIKGLRK